MKLLSPGSKLILVAALVLSIGSFIYFFSRGMTNFYGDGIAHVNIARKVVDHPDQSLWQRYIQIGTPWLPLQTVMMLPFVGIDSLWRSGAAGSIVSMFCFVIAALFLFLHGRRIYSSESASLNRVLPVTAAAIFLLNPSMLYFQTTPMSEMVFIAALIVSVYLIQRWYEGQLTQSAQSGQTKKLGVAGAAMAVATLSRYEAWPVGIAAVIVVASLSIGSNRVRLRNSIVYGTTVLLGPAYWFWHNWAIYDNPIEFLTGPYSARGIFLDNQAALGWSSIMAGNVLVAVALMLAATAVCAGPILVLLAAAGLFVLTGLNRKAPGKLIPTCLLFVPFAFHVLSVYRGEIQIFPLSAFGLLNIRYGLIHVLPVALLIPATILFLTRFIGLRAAIPVFALVLLQYVYLVSEGPTQLAIFQEGYRNGVNSRSARQLRRASSYLKEKGAEAVILMHTGRLGPLVPAGGLQFKDLIHEGTTEWHSLDQGIPGEVETIILRDGDPLEERLRANTLLDGQLNSQFKTVYSDEGLKVLRRHRIVF